MVSGTGTSTSIISDLPNEILLRIFRNLIIDAYNTTQVLIALGSVCSDWRGIIHREPLLWTTIHLKKSLHSYLGMHDYTAILGLYYQNLGNHLLNVEIDEYWRPPDGILKGTMELILGRYSSKLESFRICGQNTWITGQILKWACSPKAEFPFLKSLTLVVDEAWKGVSKTDFPFREAPQLQDLEILSAELHIHHVAINSLDLPWARLSTLALRGCHSPAVLELLSLCLNLTELVFDVTWEPGVEELGLSRVITLPGVKRFTWLVNSGSSFAEFQVAKAVCLTFIRLPSLKELDWVDPCSGKHPNTFYLDQSLNVHPFSHCELTDTPFLASFTQSLSVLKLEGNVFENSVSLLGLLDNLLELHISNLSSFSTAFHHLVVVEDWATRFLRVPRIKLLHLEFHSHLNEAPLVLRAWLILIIVSRRAGPIGPGQVTGLEQFKPYDPTSSHWQKYSRLESFTMETNATLEWEGSHLYEGFQRTLQDARHAHFGGNSCELTW